MSESTRPAPIFVVGPPRSGTTLTGRILNGHSKIFVAAERSFFDGPYSKFANAADWREKFIDALGRWIARVPDPRLNKLLENPDLRRRMHAAPDPAALYDIFMTAQAEAFGKSRWCEHGHSDMFHVPEIFAMFPDAKVVICIRHPLDFMASYRDKWQRNVRRGRPEEAQRLQQLYHPVVTSFFWLMNIKAVRRALGRWPASTLLVRYEELVSDPLGAGKRICAFVGEGFEPAMLQTEFNNSSLDVKGGIFTSSIGRWKETLPASDAYVTQLMCRGAMRRLAYEPARIGLKAGEVLRHFATAPVSARRALSTKKRPLVPFIAKRLGLAQPRARREAGSP